MPAVGEEDNGKDFCKRSLQDQAFWRKNYNLSDESLQYVWLN